MPQVSAEPHLDTNCNVHGVDGSWPAGCFLPKISLHNDWNIGLQHLLCRFGSRADQLECCIPQSHHASWLTSFAVLMCSMPAAVPAGGPAPICVSIGDWSCQGSILGCGSCRTGWGPSFAWQLRQDVSEDSLALPTSLHLCCLMHGAGALGLAESKPHSRLPLRLGTSQAGSSFCSHHN